MSKDDVSDELERYQRQIILPEIGLEGQKKLQNAKVLCIGAGGLGSPILLYLAAAGVGTLGIMDPDKVAISNLQRQILFRTNQTNLDKATAAGDYLQALNPNIEIISYIEMLSSENAIERMQAYDIVIDASDNFTAKYLINDCAAKLGIPMVYGSIMGFEGQASIFWASHGPCYRCLYPEPPKNHIPNCAEFGVIGAIAGLIGSIQAFEVMKLILNHPSLKPLIGSMALFDAANMQMTTYQLEKNEQCPVCSCAPNEIKLDSISSPQCELAKQSIKSIDVEAFSSAQDSIIIDVREDDEWNRGHIPGAMHLPLSKLSSSTVTLENLDKKENYIIYCQHGIRSQKAAGIFINHGFGCVAHLRGGFVHYYKTIVGEEHDVL
jgi:sulfur-carrier protein adenylyltransferase/sulfurtransferase